MQYLTIGIYTTRAAVFSLALMTNRKFTPYFTRGVYAINAPKRVD